MAAYHQQKKGVSQRERSTSSHQNKYFNLSIKLDSQERQSVDKLQQKLISDHSSPYKYKDRISLMADMIKSYKSQRGPTNEKNLVVKPELGKSNISFNKEAP